jgi:hypothetical protein
MIMEPYDNDINNDKHGRKKTHTQSKVFRRFITTLPTVLLLLTILSAAPTGSVKATVGGNETGATPAPGGASVGPAGGGTNVTQSDCLPQNATTTNQSSAVNAGGANDTSTLNATLGNTTGNTTTNNTTTTTTFAPSGASIC